MVGLKFYIDYGREEKLVSRNDAEEHLSQQRGNVVLREGEFFATIVCSHTADIKPYYVFDSLNHQVDGSIKFSTAIEMAELCIALDGI